MELVQHWLDVNATWKQHLTVLFDMHCDNYSVVEEIQFVVGDVHPEGDDEAGPGGGCDTVLLQLPKVSGWVPF